MMIYTLNDMIALMCDKDISYMGKCVGIMFMLGFSVDDIMKEWKIPHSSIQQCLRCNPSIKELFANQLKEKLNQEIIKNHYQMDMGMDDELGEIPDDTNIQW